MTELQQDSLETPIGALYLFGNQDGLYAVGFEDYLPTLLGDLHKRIAGLSISQGALPNKKAAFSRYFNGELDALDGLTIKPIGTDFQIQTWLQLRKIPAATCCSYQELAEQLGRPKAVRAVGAANGANPLPIVLPCHRVIGSNKQLTGYAGGLERKAWLLRHEGYSLI